MINKDNFKALLKYLGFEENNHAFSKNFAKSKSYLSVDFKKETLIYPESDGLKINERQTCNFASAENTVVFECVCKLLEKGYKPKHIELEPKWKLGHGASGGRADILVKDQKDKPLLIIECKTFGKEFNKAWKETIDDGGQLFSYAQQISETEFLCLYASEFDTKADSGTGQILVEQRIISHKDNEKIIELGEKLTSYKKASNVKRRFEVWRETYQLEYTETGVFEENIQPYQIGKSNYTLDIDTRPVTEKDKKGKYHRFRTILRQHNVARRETAFEVLVNLFLAKIVDEEENKNDLEFYWKGVAYDNYYDFIDRLQKLYQIGMRKFLKDEVMYISSEQIDGAFWTVKNKKNATKKQIQKYFRDLKFFSNNAFSLINVHNERLFNQNTKVLVELVQMWQGLRLKTKEQNQFLGDMFEYFLDNSIKQSEGQFFTPMPITKFIVASLPLENKIQQASEPLAVIDFACGAGHFLTEYAHQIKALVEKHKQTDLSQYYEQIIGIEKEDRLAKIAKVSAYMYGQDQIKIIEEDALGDITDMKPASFDVLVANPPFAVEGFLLNLNEKQKEKYELIKTTEINSNPNNIQCFFIERAKQLMAGGGVVGVIVPSSILSNADGTHIATREIILKYFDLIALVELGSGTFGKTGTNTVVFFLRRKDKKPEPAEHYQNRVDDYFEGVKSNDPSTAEYQDLYLIQKYCEHNELPFEEYKKLFGITPETISNIDELFKAELFTEYKKDFNASTDIKNLKKKKIFKDKSKHEQETELNKRLIAYLQKIEKDKLYYFMLAFENPQKVLIVKSPSNNKEQKKFLGYEWSGAKGSEGIKYHGGSTVNDIITPLFNPKNTQDKSKINYLIEQNFLGNPPDDLSEFSDYKDLITYANVQDILDFSRKDFNKAFSLTPKKSILIESKWSLVKLGKVAPYITDKISLSSINTSDYITTDNLLQNRLGVVEFTGTPNIDRITAYQEEDILISNIRPYLKKIWMANKKGGCSNDVLVFRSAKPNEYLPRYIFNVLSSDLFFDYVMSGKQGVKMPRGDKEQIVQFPIPLPPKDIQQKIVTECEAIDKATKQAQKAIDEARNEIEEKISTINSETTKLKELSKINPSKTELKDLALDTTISFIEMASVSNDGYIEQMVDKPYKDLRKGSYTYFAENDIIIAKITPSMENGKSALAEGLTNGLAMGSSEFHVIRVSDKLSPKYVFTMLNRDSVRKDAATKMTGSSGHRRVPASFYENFQIPVPLISEQKKLVTKIEKLELQIKKAQQTIEKAPQKKQKILDKHLK